MSQVSQKIDNGTLVDSLHDSQLLCCPLCKGLLAKFDDRFKCEHCEKAFPIISGIPDFRVFGDPYLGFEDDYERTRLVADNVHRFDFPELLKFYWSNSPETPEPLRKKFIRSVLAGESKGAEILKAVDSFNGAENESTRNVLEIGCGTGGFLVTAAQKYNMLVGADIALRWLTVARKRFEEAGIEVPLVCCCAEHLPFPKEAFDLVVGSATLEHTRYQDKVVLESHRVLRPNGRFFLGTPNRYSLSVEPHVYLWGVGFLPRQWMKPYVKFWKKVEYKNIRLLSWFELNQILKKSYREVRFSLPDIDDKSYANFNRWEKLQVALYRWLRARSLFRAFLLLFGPAYHIFCQKEASK